MPELLKSVPWEPAAVPAGKARVVSIDLRLSGVPLASSSLLVFWDGRRSVVRTLDGLVRWYEDGNVFVYRLGSSTIQSIGVAEGTLYPRGCYERLALMVRSLKDLGDWANIERVVSATEDLVHFGASDGCVAVATRSTDTGIVLAAAGLQPAPWTVRAISEGLIDEAHPALQPHDVQGDLAAFGIAEP